MISEQRRNVVFSGVFREMGFPYLSADLDRVREAVEVAPANEPTYVGFPLPDGATDRRSAFVAAIAGFLGVIDVDDSVKRAFASAVALREPETNARYLGRSFAPVQMYSVFETGDRLYWRERSLWPLAYSTFLGQLAAIVEIHRFAIEQRRAQLPIGSVVSEFPRLLPTRFHYAFASLGAWLGGAINVQFFGLYGTEPQITDGDTNRRYAVQMGYTDVEADALDDSGFIAVPVTLHLPLAAAQGDPTIFGSIALGEQNSANLPVDPASVSKPHRSHPGLLIDKYYRAPFFGRRIDDVALYGAETVLRDHYEDFYRGLGATRLLRCKHYCAPLITVAGSDEMEAIVARIPQRSESGLHFRGQAQLFALARHPRVRRMLFGESCDFEPSLTTSAARRKFGYDDLHFSLRYYLTDRICARGQASGDMSIVERWREACGDPACRLDFALMALAQHYGLPSHGLDVTRDLRVATWFAVNGLTVDPNGRARYEAMSRGGWHADEDRWPVVFVHQAVTHSIIASLQDCKELEAFGFLALRPRRQAARFFHGGHSDHQNRLAETVVCALRLAPGDYDTGYSFSDLFPSPAEDDAYRTMLDFSSSYGLASGSVLRFH